MSDEAKVSRVLAWYARYVDARDGTTQKSLFTDDVVLEIFCNVNGERKLTYGPTTGSNVIEHATNHVLPKHPPGGWSHHFTMDHIVEIDGDTAKLNAQFFTTKAFAILEPEGGWPEGTYGSQGRLTIEGTGYYECDLKKVDGEWKISHHRVINDLPWIFPK